MVFERQAGAGLTECILDSVCRIRDEGLCAVFWPLKKSVCVEVCQFCDCLSVLSYQMSLGEW